MHCIYCGQDTKVTNSRLQKRANQVWRRRKCLACKAIFTTTETVDLSAALLVAKERHVEPFSRDKLLISVNDSLKHRKTPQTDASSLTDTIIQLLPRPKDAKIDSELLKAVTLAVLKRFDQAAAVHYAAFHTQ